MSRRYLFGPVSQRFVELNLQVACVTGDCIPFDSTGRAGFAISDADSWETIQKRLPHGWRPDFIVLDLHYTTIPPCLWKSPVPLVGLAADWNWLWHAYRHLLRQVDLVLTDTSGVERLAREGILHAEVANLFGLEAGWLLGDSFVDRERPIDLLFIGNFQQAVQRHRLPWLARLASLGERWNVSLVHGVFDERYRSLLQEARIVFNRSVRGECNMRAFEAAAAGALLFQEESNQEITAYFRDRHECVLYTDKNLGELLEYYLTHEDERSVIAEAARSRVGEFTFAKLWQRHLERIEQSWPLLIERMHERLAKAQAVEPSARVWQALSSSLPVCDTTLVQDVTEAVTAVPGSTDLYIALGMALATTRPGGERQAIGEAFERAVRSNASHPVASLNLVETLALVGQLAAAIDLAKNTLELLDRNDAHTDRSPSEKESVPERFDWLNAPHYPPGFDLFRVEWERAAWSHAGDRFSERLAKQALLRWRLHHLLAELTQEMAYYFEAVSARPDLPNTQAALGCALARAGQGALAVSHLRAAVGQNPFDLDAARALFQVLKDIGDMNGQRLLIRSRRLLAKAAPRLVPPEPWFTEPPVAAAPSKVNGRSPDQVGPLTVIWEGDHEGIHSLAMVNRALCRQLLLRGHKLAALASGHSDSPEQAAATAGKIEAFCQKTPRRSADAYVRHQWPPRLSPPPTSHWVMMQQWEFGSLPCAWIEPMSRQVDEIWVASQWVRRCYIESGIPGERVHVIRQGVDPTTFHPINQPLPLHTRKGFKFLFVGGSIHRKGIDLLLRAYAQTFTKSDDVCLVIKDMGKSTFYRGMTAERQIAELQARRDAPEIEYLDRTLSTEELARLYTACDCLVHPFRGEGFGLPIAEAMASGRPVIVTRYGPTFDFCSDETAYLIPARVVRLAEKKIGDEPTVDYPWLAEPDFGMLQTLMRQVFEHPAQARAKGEAAHKHIFARFTWDLSAAEIESRLLALRQLPIRRLQKQIQQANHALSAIGNSRPTIHDKLLSACLIVKNEEDNLPACLESIHGLADELIIVDTGSTDRTKEIASQFGARVFDFPWVDSFAAARNECLRHATGEWIFWLDADDRLDAENREKLRDLVARLLPINGGSDLAGRAANCSFDAFVMTCRCLSSREESTMTEVQHVRLFRNHPLVRWEHRIHEQILPAIRRLGGAARFTDVVIEHTGYQDPDLRVRKRERDLRLLLLEYAEQPDHPFTLFNLGMTYLDLKRSAEALELLQRSLDRSAPADSIVRKLYYMIVQCHRQMGQPIEALETCRKGRSVYPQDAELLAQEALLLNEQNDFDGAEKCYLKLLNDRELPHFSSVPVGLNGYLTRHNLAVIYHRQGRLADAELRWREAITEHPEFESSWLGLEDLFARQARWADLEALASDMEKRPTLASQASIVRARGHLCRQEYDIAKRLLQELIAKEPRALRPRVLLSHVLLQEGRDAHASEQALLDVLAMDPKHAEAQANLSVLRMSRRGSAVV